MEVANMKHVFKPYCSAQKQAGGYTEGMSPCPNADSLACAVAQWVKPLPIIPVSHTDTGLCPAAPLLIPAIGLGKAVENGPGTWPAALKWETQMKCLASTWPCTDYCVHLG